jgi:hypothetical protein
VYQGFSPHHDKSDQKHESTMVTAGRCSPFAVSAFVQKINRISQACD